MLMFAIFSVQEPKQFNDFLQHLYKFCQEKGLKNICESLATHNVTLITKKEAADRSVGLFL